MKLRLVLLCVCFIVTACDRGYVPDRDMVKTKGPTKYELGLLKKSADEGDSNAQFVLAVYHNDHKNYAEAVKWATLAAGTREKSAVNLIKEFEGNMPEAQLENGRKLALEWKSKKDKEAAEKAAKDKDVEQKQKK